MPPEKHVPSRQATAARSGPAVSGPAVSGSGPDARPSSALEDALARVGDRWTLLVVSALLDQPLRFGDLLAAIPGLAPNILSSRIRHLVREGLVVSAPYCRRPLRLIYSLSAPGAELAGAIHLLARWGAGGSPDAESLRHPECGTPMEARWYCPTCARLDSDGPGDRDGDEGPEVYLV